MARVKRGTIQRRRHNKILKAAKGYRGLSAPFFTLAKRRVLKADARLRSSYQKRDFRRLWIARINAAVRPQGLSYSRFMYLLSGKDRSGSQSFRWPFMSLPCSRRLWRRLSRRVSGWSMRQGMLHWRSCIFAYESRFQELCPGLVSFLGEAKARAN